jgi:F0F1-type ATP synthase epsilon subunit
MMVRILSPQGMQFEGEAHSLNAKTLSGEITVLDHHHPLMTALTRGMVHVEGASVEREIEIESGFLEVDGNNNVVMLIN